MTGLQRPALRRHRVAAAHCGRPAAADRPRRRDRSRGHGWPSCAGARDEIDARDRRRSRRATWLCSTRPALRDRYQQFAATARELLSDFREVEENFRRLDRAARERIAAWDGSQGRRCSPSSSAAASTSHSSDQGRSFQAFYDFLLSEARQDELTDLLAQVQPLDAVEADRRLRTHPPRLVRRRRAHPADRPADLRAAAPLPRRPGVAGESPRARPRPRHRGVGAGLPRPAAGRSACEVDEPGVEYRPAVRAAALSTPVRLPRVDSLLDPDADDEADVDRPCSARRSSTRPGWPTTSAPAVPERGLRPAGRHRGDVPGRAGCRRDRRLPRARRLTTSW